VHSSHPPSDAPRDRVLRVRLSADEYSRLSRLADAQGRPMAAIVRSALAFTVFSPKGRPSNV
jgi:hypothetical protein